MFINQIYVCLITGSKPAVHAGPTQKAGICERHLPCNADVDWSSNPGCWAVKWSGIGWCYSWDVTNDVVCKPPVQQSSWCQHHCTVCSPDCSCAVSLPNSGREDLCVWNKLNDWQLREVVWVFDVEDIWELWKIGGGGNFSFFIQPF